jgi:hypothetical protein
MGRGTDRRWRASDRQRMCFGGIFWDSELGRGKWIAEANQRFARHIAGIL